MSKIVIGCDPDAKAHGVAVYIDGGLCHLKSMNTIELYEYVKELPKTVKITSISAHIENVKGNNSVFMKPGRMDKKREAEAKARGRTLGLCQQSQTELERVFEALNIPVTLYKISKEWKSQAGKRQFELVTKWKGRSNEDTRSASYFGYLVCK